MRRGGLFLKYAVALVGLVTFVLAMNGAVDAWFTYRDAKDALVRIQDEKAVAAAQRIEQFVAEIERQIGWTTHAQWAAGTVEQRRFDYVRLLRQVPAITELVQLDGEGKEQLKVSRLAMDAVGSGEDWSKDPRFIEARASRVWFSPVYFRKESEPYLSLAVAHAGRGAGVTVAEVNLKLIWDVITAIKTGQRGYAYVVDGRGRLIAHPDISLVLRNTDLSSLPQVAAARSAAALIPIAPALDGREVLVARAPIQRLGWFVFLELPLAEALQPLRNSLYRIGFLLLLGFALAIVAGLVLARRMVVPIRAVATGAERLGAGALGHRIDVKTEDEIETLAVQFNRMAARLEESYAGLERKVEERTAELRETLDHQTATAEVLQLISRSDSELQPVLETLLATAARLCAADSAMIFLLGDGFYRLVASHGFSPEYKALVERTPISPGRGTLTGRTVVERRAVQIEDITADPEYEWTESKEIGGFHTVLGLPLFREEAVAGVIALARTAVRPFTDRQVEVVRTFADQASIAIENARLLAELRARSVDLARSVEELTATSNVLRAISGSPGDLSPVFDAMMENAIRICEADFGWLWTYDGKVLKTAAHFGAPQALVNLAAGESVAAGPGSLGGRTVLERRVVHIQDALHDPDYTWSEAQRAGNFRTMLGVPLLREETPIGAFSLFRSRVQPFTDKQISLVATFADQAVIAIENARLLTELRERSAELARSVEALEVRGRELGESLAQQTATAEILKVITTSPGDLGPVFETMLAKATELCEAKFGILWLYDGEFFRVAALRGASAEYAEFLTRAPVRPSPETGLGRVARDKSIVHIADVADDDLYRAREPLRVATVELGGTRTFLAVPLLKESAVIGIFTIYRQEVRPFSEKQIALLANFATQAVIAIENVRLLEELQARTSELSRSVEELTATAEVLRVIASSPGKLDSVLRTLAEKAARLCEGQEISMLRVEGDHLRHVAVHGMRSRQEFFAEKDLRPLSRNTAAGRAIIERRAVHIPDVRAVRSEYPDSPAHNFPDIRTVLAVPLLREGVAIGAIVAVRTELRPFSTKHIELLTTFADQAVIAIENARLLGELETRSAELARSVEELTASAEVLRIIASSPDDVQPVFDTILANATRICEARIGNLLLYDGEAYHVRASVNEPPAFAEFMRRGPIRPAPETGLGRLIATRRPYQVLDAADDPLYIGRNPLRVATVELAGARTILHVPMLKGERLVGAIVVYRPEVRAFTERQVELVSTFADQAAIALENVALLDALRARSAELARSVEELHALREVGQAVSASLDLRTVLATIVERAVALAGAESGAMWRYDKGARTFHLRVAHGLGDDLVDLLKAMAVREEETTMTRAIRGNEPVEIADLAEGPALPLRELLIANGFRSGLIVPLIGARRIYGTLTIQRRVSGAFPPQTVALMQAFANQSVLAIQNARLFREIEEKGHQLAIASQHKSQFLANMSHELRTPLNAILGFAELLVDGLYGALPEKAQGVLERIQANGRHLLGLINDVLDLSKIEAGQLALSMDEYSLPAMVQAVVLATEGLARAKGVELVSSVEDDPPLGRGDERRLTQVLLNLVGNAIKFTDEGRVEIRATHRGGAFEIAVDDTGPGIAEADQARIFEEFQQVDATSTRTKGGTGLGLAIARRIVEMHGGTLTVDSKLGEGSTFLVRVPVKAEPRKEAAE